MMLDIYKPSAHGSDIYDEAGYIAVGAGYTEIVSTLLLCLQ